LEPGVLYRIRRPDLYIWWNRNRTVPSPIQNDIFLFLGNSKSEFNFDFLVDGKVYSLMFKNKKKITRFLTHSVKLVQSI
jgi:hypothetical protein